MTGLRTQELVTLLGLASAAPTGTLRAIGVEATGINACPCAQGLVRERAAGRLEEAGFDEKDVERISSSSRSPPTSAAAARCHRYQARLRGEELVDIVEGSMSAPICTLLKRPDELFVVEHAHLQPRFVEDTVRVMIGQVLERYGSELSEGDFVHARQVNFETIHNHEVLAERSGTVGELRGGSRPGDSRCYRDSRELAAERRLRIRASESSRAAPRPQ